MGLKNGKLQPIILPEHLEFLIKTSGLTEEQVKSKYEHFLKEHPDNRISKKAFKEMINQGIPKTTQKIGLKNNPMTLNAKSSVRNHGSLINKPGSNLFRMPSNDAIGLVQVPRSNEPTGLEVRNKRPSYTGLSSFNNRTVQSVGNNKSKPAEKAQQF